MIKEADIKIKEHVVINALLFDVIEYDGDYMMSRGIFTSFSKAVGEAYNIANNEYCDIAREEKIITPLFRLEADSGYGFSVKTKSGDTLDTLVTFYILDVGNEGDIISNQ